jgi:hypothetical protein
MNPTTQTARLTGEKKMNTKLQTARKESKPLLTAATFSRAAGVSAILAGLSYIVVGLFHPLNVLASVTTPAWANVHLFAISMAFFGLFGIAGLYVRQAEKSRWLSTAGFVMLSLWLALVLAFSFVEAFILPRLVTLSPAFVDGIMRMFDSAPSDVDLGPLPLLWLISGPLYMLGGLLFGIATFRAGVLPRWAGVLLALGTALAPIAALLPPEAEAKITIPVGLALAWLGYALFTERRAPVSESVTSIGNIQPLQPATE